MATFKLPKNVDEVTEGVDLPEDWYECRLVKDPVVDLNRKAKDAGLTAESDSSAFAEVDGAGKNLVLELRVQSSVPEYHGRPLRTWLPIPMPGDDSRYTPLGQTQEDSKMQRMMEVFEAFGSPIEDDEATLEPGASAVFYVELVQHFADPNKKMNQISMNHKPRKVE